MAGKTPWLREQALQGRRQQASVALLVLGGRPSAGRPALDSRMAGAVRAASSVLTMCSSALSANLVASAIVMGLPASPV